MAYIKLNILIYFNPIKIIEVKSFFNTGISPSEH